MSIHTTYRSLIALIATLGVGAAAATSKEATVSFSSYGTVRIGMTVEELTSAVGQALTEPNPDVGSEGCRYVQPEHGDGNVAFMLIDERLARIDVATPSIRTSTGAHVGMKASEVMRLYGRQAKVTPHAYTDGTYITVRTSDGKFGIRFETDSGLVTSYYAGTSEAIEYIEGCL